MAHVVLRSEDPDLIETVRSVLAVTGIPLAVYPESAAPPTAGLLLDGGTQPAAPTAEGGRYARVGLWDRRGEVGEDALLLPHDAESLLTLAQAANRTLRAKTVGVVGSRGGVGASVFAVALARVGAEASLGTALVEGSGSPALASMLPLGGGPRWADLPAAPDPAHLVRALPTWAGVRVLLGDERRTPEASRAEAAIAALAQSHDLLVLDLQRHDVAGGITTRWCEVVVLVTTCDLPAVRAAEAMRHHLSAEEVHLLVRGPARAGYTPGAVERALAVRAVTRMRREWSLPGGIERGIPPGEHRRGPLLRAARGVLDALEVRGQ